MESKMFLLAPPLLMRDSKGTLMSLVKGLAVTIVLGSAMWRNAVRDMASSFED
jgi:hypothetical protein